MRTVILLLVLSRISLSEPHIDVITGSGKKISHPIVKSADSFSKIKFLAYKTTQVGEIDSNNLSFITLKHPSDFLPNMASAEIEFSGKTIKKIIITIIDNKKFPFRNHVKHETIWNGLFQKYTFKFINPKIPISVEELYSLFKTKQIEINVDSNKKNAKLSLTWPNCLESNNYSLSGECLIRDGKSIIYQLIK